MLGILRLMFANASVPAAQDGRLAIARYVGGRLQGRRDAHAVIDNRA